LISPISSTILSILLTILLNIVACPINPQNNRAIPADARPPGLCGSRQTVRHHARAGSRERCQSSLGYELVVAWKIAAPTRTRAGSSPEMACLGSFRISPALQEQTDTVPRADTACNLDP
jgi:hypothetical protein